LYRLELSIDSEGLGRVPLLALDNAIVSDKYFLESLKFPPASPSADEMQRMRPVNARLGEAAAMLGYWMSADNPTRLVLYWQSQARASKNYTVFVHLLDANGNVRAQIDREPRNGTYPTSVWEVGEIVRDEYEVPRDLPAGDYWIELGMYEFPSLARLPISDLNGKILGDHLILSDPLKVAK
jgi:hypothetical protein